MSANVLPDKLSDLAELALNDLENCEAAPGLYVINMNAWHDPCELSRTCDVCMAGAVIANTLGANPQDLLEPNEFNRDTANKLNAIDDLRIGDVSCALFYLNREDASNGKLDREIPDYSRGPEIFKSAIRGLIADLREAGL